MNKYLIETLKLILIFVACMWLAHAYATAQDSTTVRVIGRDTVVKNVRTGIVFIRLEKPKANGRRK